MSWGSLAGPAAPFSCGGGVGPQNAFPRRYDCQAGRAAPLPPGWGAVSPAKWYARVPSWTGSPPSLRGWGAVSPARWPCHGAGARFAGRAAPPPRAGAALPCLIADPRRHTCQAGRAVSPLVGGESLAPPDGLSIRWGYKDGPAAPSYSSVGRLAPLGWKRLPSWTGCLPFARGGGPLAPPGGLALVLGYPCWTSCPPPGWGRLLRRQGVDTRRDACQVDEQPPLVDGESLASSGVSFCCVARLDGLPPPNQAMGVVSPAKLLSRMPSWTGSSPSPRGGGAVSPARWPWYALPSPGEPVCQIVYETVVLACWPGRPLLARCMVRE